MFQDIPTDFIRLGFSWIYTGQNIVQLYYVSFFLCILHYDTLLYFIYAFSAEAKLFLGVFL